MAAGLAFDGDTWPQDCRICRREGREHLRAKWGCDRDVRDGESDVLPRAFTCPYCPEQDPDPKCEVCAGTGEWSLRQCPHVFIDVLSRRAVACAGLVELGILPADGGWQDQTAWFQQAACLAIGEKRAYEESRRRSSMEDVSRGRQ